MKKELSSFFYQTRSIKENPKHETLCVFSWMVYVGWDRSDP
jgi:hypothetical protein